MDNTPLYPSELFDRVKNHLLQQGDRALLDDGSYGCAYRNSNGYKCAAGCLIPDALYRPEVEHTGIVSLVLKYGVTNIFGRELAMPGRSLDLLERLQEIHDGVPAEDWEEELNLLAEEFNVCLEL